MHIVRNSTLIVAQQGTALHLEAAIIDPFELSARCSAVSHNERGTS